MMNPFLILIPYRRPTAEETLEHPWFKVSLVLQSHGRRGGERASEQLHLLSVYCVKLP